MHFFKNKLLILTEGHEIITSPSWQYLVKLLPGDVLNSFELISTKKPNHNEYYIIYPNENDVLQCKHPAYLKLYPFKLKTDKAIMVSKNKLTKILYTNEA